jgi:hypothetical protein
MTNFDVGLNVSKKMTAIRLVDNLGQLVERGKLFEKTAYGR